MNLQSLLPLLSGAFGQNATHQPQQPQATQSENPARNYYPNGCDIDLSPPPQQTQPQGGLGGLNMASLLPLLGGLGKGGGAPDMIASLLGKKEETARPSAQVAQTKNNSNTKVEGMKKISDYYD